VVAGHLSANFERQETLFTVRAGLWPLGEVEPWDGLGRVEAGFSPATHAALKGAATGRGKPWAYKSG
jgi:hypothetical protein